MTKKILSGRRLAIALGILWLIDGIAQLQPKMFTSKFPNDVILPITSGQPHYLVNIIHFFVNIFLKSPVFFNICIIITQAGLGILILYKKTSLIALKLSILWALFVWIVGEGMGGLLSFNGNLLIGFPGAAAIYVLLAFVAIRQLDKTTGRSYSGYISSFFWALVWLVGGIYQLLSKQNSVSTFLSYTMPMKGQPGWMYNINLHFSNWLNSVTTSGHAMTMSMNQTSSGYWFIILLAIIEILIGISIFLPRKISFMFIWLGIALSLVFWLIGQSLGGYYSGLATDPNTGTLLVILGLVVLSLKDKDKYLKNVYKRIEEVFT